LTQRGHGDASHPNSGYRLDDFSGDLLEFMEVKGIREAIIVGHSMGSAVAQRFAVDNPDKSLGLILAGASIAGQGDPKVQEFFDSTISRLVDPIDPNFVRQFSASMRVKEIPEELFEMVVQDALKVPARVWIQAFRTRC
jgi:pimeloyl-ACP methyl ester carboxylesterase